MGKKERKAFLRGLAEKNKPNFAIVEQAKQLWETVRSSKTKENVREECVAKLLKLVEGKLTQLIYKHDTCRVIQYLMGLKREDIRTLLFDELTPEIVRMAKDKYAKFFVAKMLRYGTHDQRNTVIEAFNGHCASMLRISHAAQILETAYNDWASPDQRRAIVCEFYGPEFVLFKHELQPSEMAIEKIATNKPEKIVPIMKNLEELLENVVQKIGTLKLSLTHKLLFDYLTHGSVDQRKSIIDSLKDQLPEICHTRDGSRAAIICIWHADPKERKAIVKSFKGLAVKSCLDSFARRALFAIFDVVDDTRLVNKYITKEIADNLADVIYNKSGVWVLHYLVHPRDRRVIGKGLHEILLEGDNNEHSKKLSTERYAELFECVRDPLLMFMAANMRELIFNKVSAVLVLDTLEPNDPNAPFQREIPTEQKAACFRAIAGIAGEEFIPNAVEGDPHIIATGCGRFVFRKLIQSDPHQMDVKLSDFLAELPAEHLQTFAGTNSGCFALLEMARSGSEKARDAVRQAVNLAALRKSTHLVGATALYADLLTDARKIAGVSPKVERILVD